MPFIAKNVRKSFFFIFFRALGGAAAYCTVAQLYFFKTGASTIYKITKFFSAERSPMGVWNGWSWNLNLFLRSLTKKWIPLFLIFFLQQLQWLKNSFCTSGVKVDTALYYGFGDHYYILSKTSPH